MELFTKRTALLVVVAAFSLVAGACGDPPPPPAEPVHMPPPDPSPPLSPEDQEALDADFTAARKLVDEAKAVEAAATTANKAKRGAGIEGWVKAAGIYSEAMKKVGRWMEPAMLKVTPIQLEYRLKPYVDERDNWRDAAAAISGKIAINR